MRVQVQATRSADAALNATSRPSARGGESKIYCITTLSRDFTFTIPLEGRCTVNIQLFWQGPATYRTWNLSGGSIPAESTVQHPLPAGARSQDPDLTFDAVTAVHSFEEATMMTIAASNDGGDLAVQTLTLVVIVGAHTGSSNIRFLTPS